MNKIRYDDWAFTIFLKVVATAAFLWSGFFWSGVTILNFYMFNTDESYRATGFLVASIILLVSLILMFLRMYIIQFPLCVVGSIIYLVQAGQLIDVIESYTIRYIPELLLFIVSLILFILHMARVISKSLGEKETFNTSPAESIIGDGVTVEYRKEEKPKKEKKSRKEKKKKAPEPEYSEDPENNIDETTPDGD
ncbi:MAG: hypothetical protein LUE20_01745 [Oscillospiraceae bacterium]|nr:hypothetical protein [Oscillospiraceae bacterium]